MQVLDMVCFLGRICLCYLEIISVFEIQMYHEVIMM